VEHPITHSAAANQGFIDDIKADAFVFQNRTQREKAVQRLFAHFAPGADGPGGVIQSGGDVRFALLQQLGEPGSVGVDLGEPVHAGVAAVEIGSVLEGHGGLPVVGNDHEVKETDAPDRLVIYHIPHQFRVHMTAVDSQTFTDGSAVSQLPGGGGGHSGEEGHSFGAGAFVLRGVADLFPDHIHTGDIKAPQRLQRFCVTRQPGDETLSAVVVVNVANGHDAVFTAPILDGLEIVADQ